MQKIREKKTTAFFLFICLFASLNRLLSISFSFILALGIQYILVIYTTTLKLNVWKALDALFFELGLFFSLFIDF